MADLDAARASLASAIGRRDELATELADLGTQLADERRQLAALEASGAVAEAAAARDRIAVLVAARAAPTRDLAALHGSVAAQLEVLLGAELALEATVPLVLLPVRVEVRSNADQSALRVRIYPDAVHTESLDEGLTDQERAVGIAYWTTLWPDGDVLAPWKDLVTATGALRAPWVAEALRPLNLAKRPDEPPQFPDTAKRGTLPVVARTLPDRFYVRIEQDGAEPRTVHGTTIPDELPVGLADRDDLSRLKIDGEDLPPIDESLRWLVDYVEAEKVGMAITVPLPVAGQAVRRLLVYGVRAALEPELGAARLTRTIRSHRFTDGAEFLPQGTPTNNTESARTAWSRRTRPGPPDLGSREPHDSDNASVTAAALGVDGALLASLPHGGDPEQLRAAALNRLLWTTTWGEAIEHLTPAGRANGDARLDSTALDEVRDHWIHHVRGRGPLPALRLGRQPYGVLPIVITAADAWTPSDAGVVERRLVPFLDGSMRWMWDAAEADVPTIMNQPLDEALPKILGTDATLEALRVRTALSRDPSFETAMALTIPDVGDRTSQRQVSKVALVLAGIAEDALDDNPLGTKSRALALPLVHESDPEFIKSLLEPDPPDLPALSVLQVLLAHAAELERHVRTTDSDPETFGLFNELILDHDQEAGPQFDRQLVFNALGAVQQGSFEAREVPEAAEQMARVFGRLDRNALADRHPVPALRPVTTVEQIAGPQRDFGRLQRDPAGLQLVGEVFQRARWAAEFRDALGIMAATESIDERRLLLAETLDCCSHRLDAWLTSAASRRLAVMRARGASGTFIGAYGWLEDIELVSPAAAGQVDGMDVLHDGTDGGFVHAPGLTHAATAGVLRSGRLTHRRSDPSSEPLDIDLSSTRTRDALTLLDGMRRGQSLGALLGYRLERRLHDVSGKVDPDDGTTVELDRFIYVLRTLAPLRGGKLTDPGQPVEESIAASDVVDGLRLLETPAAIIKAALKDGPKDNTYIPANSWKGATDKEVGKVQRAIDELERTHDAVADVLLAESVHQLVSGNPIRAAAALDALGGGEAVPPEPDVVRTPRTGVPIQHRVALLVAEPAPAAIAGYAADTPRSNAEPRLEIWAQGALGDPAKIFLAAGDDQRTLADAGLSALDVLYDADGNKPESSTLAVRIRRALPELDADLAPLAATWELAGMLRAMIVGARPLDVADVGRPVTDDELGRKLDSAEWLGRAKAATEALRSSINVPDMVAALAPIAPLQLEGLDPGQQAAAIAAHDTAVADQAAAVTDMLKALAPFGVRPPPNVDALGAGEQAGAVAALVEEASHRVEAADAFLARAAVSTIVADPPSQMLEAIFGQGFVSLPVILAPPADEADLWSGAVGDAKVRPKAGAEIRPWLARMGRLRASMSAYGETMLVREAFGQRPALRVVQSPTGAFETWVGLPFETKQPPNVPISSMVAELAGGTAGGPEPDLSGAVAGLVLDEWTEVLPRRVLRGDPRTGVQPELVDVTTTGLALNANAPGARPPQIILVACSSDGADWTANRLVAVLGEAMALGRMRGLTLEQVPFVARYLPALYFRDWSLQGEPVLDFRLLERAFVEEAVTKFSITKG